MDVDRAGRQRRPRKLIVSPTAPTDWTSPHAATLSLSDVRGRGMRLDGQRVVVIGGSSGIGLGIAKVAAWAGAHVVVAGRSAGKFEAAKAEVGCEVECRVLDATD